MTLENLFGRIAVPICVLRAKGCFFESTIKKMMIEPAIDVGCYG